MKKSDSIGTLVLRLGAITLCAGLILGLVYSATKDPIEQQALRQATEARQEVLPVADDFAPLEVQGNEDGGQYAIIKEVYEGTTGGETSGYTLAVVTKAYSPNLNLTIGVDMDGVVTGVVMPSHEETPGLGANATNPDFLAQYVGVPEQYVVAKSPTGAAGEIAAISGATITSNGVTDAVTLARQYFSEVLQKGA